MALPRIIPVLLLENGGLVKTEKFKNPKYIGDPLNAVKIFNDKEVDELLFLDIYASAENRKPSLEFLAEIAGECFMPLAYGGGVRDLKVIKEILQVGIEKVVISSYAIENPSFISEATTLYGSSTIAVCIDVKKSFFGKYEIYVSNGKKNTGIDPVKFAIEMDKAGAGELIVNNIDKDGTMSGYDTELLKRITSSVGMPVIASGGAKDMGDFVSAMIEGGASAVAAGSMFVFHGKHRAILIKYPDQEEINQLLAKL
jgi:cyclase